MQGSTFHLDLCLQVISLILSDVIGDPMDIIASGPTLPNSVTNLEVLRLLDKYDLKQKIPLSILSYLQGQETRPHPQCPIKDGCYLHTQNVIIGNNRIATMAAHTMAEGLGYCSFVWSHSIQGEARDIGRLYANVSHSVLTKRGNYLSILQQESVTALLSSIPQVVVDDLTKLLEQLSTKESSSQPFCLISTGEPTVTVKEGATGVGGRSQELALSFAVELEKLSLSNTTPQTGILDDCRGFAPRSFRQQCALACVGTDGQDGPSCDAAGAMVDMDVPRLAKLAGLSPRHFLDNNDSHTFFSRLDFGRYLIHTGLTATNVMDIHILLVK